jgi:hypothetical protein
MRSLAEQTTEEMGGPLSVLVRQKRDHARLDRMLDQLSHVTGADEDDLINGVCRLVFSHAFAEESVLWPALRRHLPDGDELTTKVELEHQKITELVAALDDNQPGDPGRPELIERTVAVLRQDVRDEEDELLPRLQEALGSGGLRRLGVLWEIARRTAPTRAHPIVSRRPPGNHLAALPLTLLDRTRDAADYLARRAGPAAPVLTTASRALAAGARRVEMLPVMRRGERPETSVD